MKSYPVTINSRFAFGEDIYPVKCRAEKDESGSFYPVWYVGDSFKLKTLCTESDHTRIYLGEHRWGVENTNLALDVDAYHSLEDASHEAGLRNKHYIKR